MQVGGEGGEGDVFGGFLVVVAELEMRFGWLVFGGTTQLSVDSEYGGAYLDCDEDFVRLGVALDLFQHGGPVAAFAE